MEWYSSPLLLNDSLDEYEMYYIDIYFSTSFIYSTVFSLLCHWSLLFATVENTVLRSLLFPLSVVFRSLFCLWSSVVLLCVSSCDFFLFIFLGICCAFWIWQFWKMLMYYLNLLFLCLCYILGNLLSYIAQVIFSPHLCLINLIFSSCTEFFVVCFSYGYYFQKFCFFPQV